MNRPASSTRLVVTLALFAALFRAASSSSGDPPAETERTQHPLALVCWLEGGVNVTVQEESAVRRVQLLDVLIAGSVVQTTEKAKVIVAYMDGRRFEIGERTEALLSLDGVEAQQGSVRPLPSVPVVTKISPIAPVDDTSNRIAAGRIRQVGTGADAPPLGLDPPDDSRILAGRRRFGFGEAEAASHYRIEILDDAGRTIFASETSSPGVEVEPRILEPGRRYYWVVRAFRGRRAVVRDDAFFDVLDENQSQARQALLEQLERTRDPSLMVLLAQIDDLLGLVREACRERRWIAERLPAGIALPEPDRVGECPSTSDEGPVTVGGLGSRHISEVAAVQRRPRPDRAASLFHRHSPIN